jgi:hydroxymethylpyrimidine pyrophosphatase-like HAD family hydrolase/energy-coupling factor transporter ATP-binding protein EcfA2
MIAHVLACDYDGTVADDGRIDEATARVLARVRDSGRKLILVTGRRLDDLRAMCPEVDAMFDAIVAENGALVHMPGSQEPRQVGDAPSPALLDALRRQGVPFVCGVSIVATADQFAEPAVAAIRECGEERSLIFNKGALMLLPGGVTKQTGLTAALDAMTLSPHNTVGIGDAENDHAFLSMCECAVAVADAVPALRARADYVTRGTASRGVAEFVDEHVLEDLRDLLPGLRRHRLPLGEDAAGQVVSVGAHATNLLIVGPSGSGKSTLTGLLVERLTEKGRSVCLVDPEGDYQALSELPSVVVLGGKSERALPTPDELDQLLRQPGHSLILNLSAMTRSEKVDYVATALAAVATVRASSGMPHWIVVDEAHHVFPAHGSRAAELLQPRLGPVCLITLHAEELAKEVLAQLNAVASTEMAAFDAAQRILGEAGVTGWQLPVSREPLAHGEAVLATLGEGASVSRFRVARRRVAHRRHVRKYAEGELSPEQSFYFRGAQGQLNLRAANLSRFVELVEGVDAETWAYHLGRREYSSWIRSMIKDNELADEVAGFEASASDPDQIRSEVVAAIRRRYAA